MYVLIGLIYRDTLKCVYYLRKLFFQKNANDSTESVKHTWVVELMCEGRRED